ncbi:MAG: PAS domain-containing protein, partial [Chloroflexi bacterium]|nr:PAS domain-containing protein [Chloroflexota bacterium]
MAQLAADEQEMLIENGHQLLLALAELPQVRRRDGAACNRLFTNLLEQYPQYTALTVADPKGDVSCSAPALTQPVNVADRNWYQHLVQSHGFTVSDYLIGRVSGKAAIALAYPVLDDAGQLQAIVTTGLGLAWLNQMAAQVQLPEGSAFTVIDGQGTVLARTLEPERWVGKTEPETPLVKAIFNQPSGGTVEAAGLDGVPRLYAYAPLSQKFNVGAYVAVGIPTAIVYGEADQRLGRNLLLLAMVSVLVLVAARAAGNALVLQGVNALMGATQRMAAGDLSARTGLSPEQGELGQLGQAFDRMAEALKQREVLQREAERKYRALVENIPSVVYSAAIDDLNSTLYISPQIEGLLGFTAQEWLATPDQWTQQLHADDRARVLDAYARAAAAGQPFNAEYRLLARDGRVVWVHDQARPVLDEQGRPGYMHGTVTDITARKQAEERGRQQAACVQALADLAQLLAEMTFDEQSALQAAAQRIAEALGDICLLYLVSADGQWLKPAAFHHPDPEIVSRVRSLLAASPQRVDEGLSGRVFQSGQPLLIPVLNREELSATLKPEHRPLLDYVMPSSAIGVPLRAQGQTLGVLLLSRGDSGRAGEAARAHDRMNEQAPDYDRGQAHRAPLRPYGADDLTFAQSAADRLA